MPLLPPTVPLLPTNKLQLIAGSLCCTAKLQFPQQIPPFRSVQWKKNYPTPNASPTFFLVFGPRFPKPSNTKTFSNSTPGLETLLATYNILETDRDHVTQNTKPTSRLSTTDHISTMDFSNQGRACFTCEFAVAVSSLWLLFAPRL